MLNIAQNPGRPLRPNKPRDPDPSDVVRAGFNDADVKRAAALGFDLSDPVAVRQLRQDTQQRASDMGRWDRERADVDVWATRRQYFSSNSLAPVLRYGARPGSS